MLMMSAPWSVAHRMPLRTALVEHVPRRLQTFTAMSVVLLVIPAATNELLATVAATCVPWKYRSVITFLVGNRARTTESSDGTNDTERDRSTRPFKSKWR